MGDSGGRERVLREAVRLFGADGVDSTSVRAVAAAAGVSPANVMHHFGSKQALRAAADERVLAELTSWLQDAARCVLHGGAPQDLAPVADAGVRGYLRRVVLEGGEAGQRLVGELVALAREGLREAQAVGGTRPGADLDYGAVQVVALVVGPLLLGPLLPGAECNATPNGVASRAESDVALLREGLLRVPSGD